MTMAVSKAKEAGAEAVICASTGNTSAAAAAYARRGGMRAFVLIPDGYVAQGKLAQALLYGAEVLAVRGNFDRALSIVREMADQYPVTLVNSLNPFRLEGQKTAAFEVVDELGDAPDWLCIPMGNAGNISAYWMGFKEYRNAGMSRKLPRMMGFQAAGSAPLVHDTTVEQPDTIATAIRIGNPANPGQPLAPLRDVASGGEMSRFLLALKTCLAEADGEITLLFDEIDTGVSGKVSAAMAALLQRLAQHRQVFCVTHQPVVAAAADQHLLVSKQVEQGSTRSLIQPLSTLQERQRELAELAGGDSGEARDFAASLLHRQAA